MDRNSDTFRIEQIYDKKYGLEPRQQYEDLGQSQKRQEQPSGLQQSGEKINTHADGYDIDIWNKYGLSK